MPFAWELFHILWASSHTEELSWLSVIFIKLSHKIIFLLLPHISFAVWSHFRLLMQPDASWIIWLHAKCHFPAISMLIQLLIQFNIIQWLKQDEITSLHLWRTILLWKVITYKNDSILLNRYPALIFMTMITFPVPFRHAQVMLVRAGRKNLPGSSMLWGTQSHWLCRVYRALPTHWQMLQIKINF